MVNSSMFIQPVFFPGGSWFAAVLLVFVIVLALVLFLLFLVVLVVVGGSCRFPPTPQRKHT